MSLYNANGQQVVTIVAGTSLTGLYSASGTYNGVISSGGGWKGLYHPCGAYWVTVVSNPSSPVSFYAADGSLNIIQNSDGSYSPYFPVIGLPITQSPLTIPTGAVAAYSVVKLSTYSTNSCVDVVDGNSVTHTIGFVNNLCDFGTIASLTQPVTVSKFYDQSGNGNHAIQATVSNQPSINGSVAKAVLMDGLVTSSGSSNPSSNVTTKFLTMPSGVAINENAFSIYTVFSPKSSIVQSGYYTFNATTAYVSAYSYSQFGGTAQNNGGTLSGISNGAALFTVSNIPSQAGNILGLIGNGTTGTIDVNGVQSTFTTAAQALTGGIIGNLAGFNGFAGSFNLQAMVVYPNALSVGNQTTIKAALVSTFSIPQTFTGQVLEDGDSITYGYGGSLNQGWTRQLQAAFPSYKTFSLGIPGIGLSNLLTVEANRITPRFNSGLSKNIVTIWAGTNDIVGGATAATVYANLQTYTATAKTAGFKVVWITMLPRSDLTSPEQIQWNAYNTLMRAATLGQSNTADALADVASDPIMGVFANTSNHSYYCNVGPTDFSIGVHPTDLGNSIVAPYIISAVGSL